MISNTMVFASENQKNGLNSTPEEEALVTSVVHLYFADRQYRYLGSEIRTISHKPDSAYLGKNILRELVKGPVRDFLPTLPPNMEIRAFFMDADQTAYVDLGKGALKNIVGGCRAERLAIYSIVNSLVLNIADIRSVQILLDGESADAFAGHSCIQLPLKADMLMVR